MIREPFLTRIEVACLMAAWECAAWGQVICGVSTTVKRGRLEYLAFDLRSPR